MAKSEPLRTPSRRSYVSGSLLVAGAILLFWAPALFVPFWQDDFGFLYFAQQDQAEGRSLLAPFFPDQIGTFWRPLTEGLYWRVVENYLGADPLMAHAINLFFVVASAAAVGWLAAKLAKLVAPDVDAVHGGMLAAFLYGIHGANLIPAVWATGVHSSMVVLFSSLALGFWLEGLRTPGTTPNRRVLWMPLFFLIALFCKENAILVPALAALLSFWLWPTSRPTRLAWVSAGLCLGIAMGWLALRELFTSPPAGPHEFTFGWNLGRNAVSLFLFAFNVPRESLRFVLTERSITAALWMLACFLLQAGAFWLIWRRSRVRLSGRGRASLLLFFLATCTPYLAFSWNSYAFYVLLGLVAWGILAALADPDPRTKGIAVAAALLSSSLAVAGSYLAAYPALIARADWAERQLALVASRYQSAPQRIHVKVESRHRYLGFGPYGLAYRLGMKPEQILEVHPGTPLTDGSDVLVIPAEGDIYWETAAGSDSAQVPGCDSSAACSP